LIPVTLQPEPANFNSKVRQPGQNYLSTESSPSFPRGRRYWRKAKKDLYEAYNKICAYTCFYLSSPGSVDHFLPKSQYPHLAYEWSNYRLAKPRVNENKGISTDVIDPFAVKPGWFVLDFPSCLIKAGKGLAKIIVDSINKTIEILKLNDDDFLVQERCEIMVAYADGDISLSFIEKRYPFIAIEIRRQGIQDTAATIFRRRSL